MRLLVDHRLYYKVSLSEVKTFFTFHATSSVSKNFLTFPQRFSAGNSRSISKLSSSPLLNDKMYFYTMDAGQVLLVRRPLPSILGIVCLANSPGSRSRGGLWGLQPAFQSNNF